MCLSLVEPVWLVLTIGVLAQCALGKHRGHDRARVPPSACPPARLPACPPARLPSCPPMSGPPPSDLHLAPSAFADSHQNMVRLQAGPSASVFSARTRTVQGLPLEASSLRRLRTASGTACTMPAAPGSLSVPTIALRGPSRWPGASLLQIASGNSTTGEARTHSHLHLRCTRSS